MEPAIAVALLWLLFGGTHVGLAMPRVRARLVGVLGESGFSNLFSLIATLTFWVLVAYYAAHRFEGIAGIDAGRVPVLRWLLMGVIAGAMGLITAGLVVYPRLPVALFGQTVDAPRGVERITRHPFFVGIAVLGLAHALLAPTASGAIFMAGFAVLGIGGAHHQDAKHRRRRGRSYEAYMAQTSIIPFAAVVSGRQQLPGREMPLGAFAVGIALAVLLRWGHTQLFAAGGGWIVLAVAGGGAVASLLSFLRSRRVGARANPSARAEGGRV